MNYLAETLKKYLEQHFIQALLGDPGASVRPVLVGPPPEGLKTLFDLLTNSGTTNWHMNSPQMATNPEVTVLLVRDSPPPGITVPGIVSKECSWDYAVTARNSSPLVAILVDAQAWDNRPESLVNTTETVGNTQLDSRGKWLKEWLWKHITQEISIATTLPEDDIKLVLKEVTKQCRDLEPTLRERVPWELSDTLLNGHCPPGLTHRDTLSLVVGLPAPGAAQISLRDSLNVLERLAKFLDKYGLADGANRLKGSSLVSNHANTGALQNAIQGFSDHVSEVALSGVNFAHAPAWYYRPALRPGPAVPGWWRVLDAGLLSDLMDEVVGQQQPTGQVQVRCENALNSRGVLDGEPWIVQNSVRLRTSGTGGQPLLTPQFRRKSGNTEVGLPAVQGDALACIDPSAPPHDKPIKYIVEAQGYKANSLEVLALDSFGCGGCVHVRDALRSRPPTKPTRPRNQQIWRQEVSLPRGGVLDFDVYHATSTATVRIVQLRAGTQSISQQQQTQSGSSLVTFVLDVEDNDEVEITLVDVAGNNIGQWTVSLGIQATTQVARTRFESLIRAHQEDGVLRIPRPAETLAQEIEGSYLASADSWKPVTACWSGSIDSPIRLDWTNPKLGDTTPPSNAYPIVTPPPDVQVAREGVRQYLHNTRRSIGEIDLGEQPFAQLVENYLQSYYDWLNTNPGQATWLDCIALHAATWNSQAGRHTATSEPVVILLSPLHPLRLAWHCLAQQQLTNSLNRRCAAAGLLDPGACPDIGAWHLYQGGTNLVPRAYFALACDNPHWAILWNSDLLSEHENHIVARLTELGLETRGIASGFSISQAMSSLDEVTHLMPGRATLRVGIIGTGESSNNCAEGVKKWCIRSFGEETLVGTGAFTIDVYDMRKEMSPSPESIASLSEQTQERARWYNINDVPPASPLDLIVLDQLGAGSPGVAHSIVRSCLGQGALCRVRIREDYQDASLIKESRVAGICGSAGGLADLLQDAVVRFEGLAADVASVSHLQYRPNLQAIGTRVAQATYLALTSSQADPACVIRGSMDQQGYLWDYELPGALGGDSDTAGYYLVARPLQAMLDAITKSAQLVAPSPPIVQDLLKEISQRGIPVLKRLASGGSQSRGELGLLLAVRLLQDAFRQGATPRLPVFNGTCVHLLLPADPYEELFKRMRVGLTVRATDQRPDLLVFAIHVPPGNAPVQIKITPIEVKFREGNMGATEMREALRQAANIGPVLNAAWVQSSPTDLWATCSAALLAQCLDYAFRIYADESVHGEKTEDWAKLHQKVLQDVFAKQAQVTVNQQGRLLVFDQSSTSSVLDLDGDSRQDTAVLGLGDSQVLLTRNGTLSPEGQSAVTMLDFSFPTCVPTARLTANGGLTGTSDPSGVTGVIGASSPSSVPPASDPRAGEPGEGTSNITTIAHSNLDNGATVPGREMVTGIDDDSAERSYLPLSTSPVPQAVRERVKDAFEGFIGNEPAVRRVANDLLRALIENPPHLPKNYLFTGQPSTGKTEMARRVARALELPFVRLDGRTVASREKLLELVNGELRQQGLHPSQVGQQAGLPLLEYPPLVIFVDEVHLLPRSVQESLLTVLEAADRTVNLPSYIAKMNMATFLFATTRASDVDSAFRSRCAEVQLREYSTKEVAQVLNTRLRHNWPQEIYMEIAKLGRRVPRIALELARELETEITVSEYPGRSLRDHLREVRLARELDEQGLTLVDTKYLAVLERVDRPIGEQAILNMMGTVDKDRIMDEVEPFLARLGLIRLGARGREITAEGREYLLQKRRAGIR